ncbi:MAG TPA: AAA family ATPase [Spirochaetales bacterium]|nr:AAA family ATPase [Spirochaetales bacterium]
MSFDSPLFAGSGGGREPLAARMRPRTLDEFVGQDHIVGPGRLLRRAIQKDQLASVIFSGPPGTGKTTLARVIANTTASRFVTLNAVLDGVASVRAAVEEAAKNRDLYGRRTILFVDEVHRWNKAQQDALLPWVENGTLILIGATTENPFFEVNRALVSRSRVFQLTALTQADLSEAARRALSDPERGYGRWKVSFEDGALEHLVDTADGDARSLLNALELAVETGGESWPPPEGSKIRVTREAAQESIQRRAVLYDKDGDYHYDSISAFIKSLRGSDPDAALYWLARMIYAGEDPAFLLRRMLISASEDVGLADPSALGVVEACARAFDRVGLPEGQFHLAQAALYLATAPKSNSALGYFDARGEIEKERAEVPSHLKDASRDGPGFGHGEGYLYPHAYRDHWVAQAYLPDTLAGRIFYKPAETGYEGRIREEVLRRREAQVAAALDAAGSGIGSGASAGENLTYSEAADRRAEWLSRSEARATERLAAIRDGIFARAAPRRHERTLVADAREGFLVWEALRRVPEGAVCALVRTDRERILIEGYVAGLEEICRPSVVLHPRREPDVAAIADSGLPVFDLLVSRDLLSPAPDKAALLAAWAAAFPAARIALAESPASEGGRLSRIPALKEAADKDLAARFEGFEEGFYAGTDRPELSWKSADAEGWIRDAGLEKGRVETERGDYGRVFTQRELDSWLSPASAYGRALASDFNEDEIRVLREALDRSVLGRPVPWPFTVAYITVPPRT